MTLFNIADEIAVALGMIHDDSRMNRIALAYNVKIAIDKVRDQIITKSISLGGDQRQAADMLEVFTVTPAWHPADATINWDYHFFDLPRALYSLPGDGGLNWVRYNRAGLPRNCPPTVASAVFTHTTLGALSGLYGSTYQSPKNTRPYVARDKDRVYLFGVDPQVRSLLVGLYCTLPDLTEIDPNAEIDIPAEYLLTVKKMVIDACRFSLLVPERLKNDGRDLEPNQQIRTERLSSINDPANLSDL